MNFFNKQIIKVYSAKEYTEKEPRPDGYCDINIPEYAPTVPKDDKYTNIALNSNYFVNTNYPNTNGVIKLTHYVTLPLLKGTTCPSILSKGTPFLLFTPTTKIEEGYLLYI